MQVDFQAESNGGTSKLRRRIKKVGRQQGGTLVDQLMLRGKGSSATLNILSVRIGFADQDDANQFMAGVAREGNEGNDIILKSFVANEAGRVRQAGPFR